jgi:hypothetical protein
MRMRSGRGAGVPRRGKREQQRAGQQGPTGGGTRGSHTTQRRAQRWWWLRVLRTAGIGLFLLGMVLAFALVVGATSAGAPAGSSGQSGGGPQASGWVRIRSASPTDILSAVRATRMYQDVYNAPQTRLGAALRSGTLGVPVLVRAFHPTPGMTDVWVIPVLQSSGHRNVALLDVAYDTTHGRIRPLTFAGPFVPTDPEYNQPFPRLSSGVALAQASAALRARGIGLVPSTSPELVYFGADLDRIAGDHASIRWTGGGEFPDLAVWVITTGNQTYVVGLDDHVYAASQLPLAPSAAR